MNPEDIRRLRAESERTRDARRLEQELGVTDDRCHGRCEDLRDWFVWETRGLMASVAAHEVLDMVLNRLAADGRLAESPHPGGEA